MFLRSAKAFLKAYLRARSMGRKHQSRLHFLDWQQGEILRWGNSVLSEYPEFSDPERILLSEHPKCEKSDVLAGFELYTRDGITEAEARTAIKSGRPILVGKDGRRLHVGESTGTSGRRGLYVIDNTERFAWVGAVLGKILPDFWRRRCRIAVILPRNTALYSGVNKASPLQLRYFSSLDDVEHLSNEVAAFAPQIVICAPRMALRLGDLLPGWMPERVIVGSETAWEMDLEKLRARFSRVDQVYMATEGLLATTCDHGRLHLNEDFMHIELEPAGGGLFNPVISDFSRHSQAMVRYRMNDLVRPGKPCTCGSPLQVIDEIVGRMDDVLHFENEHGRSIPFFPDEIRETILNSVPELDDFRLVQTGPAKICLELPEIDHDQVTVLRRALSKLFLTHGVALAILIKKHPEALEEHRHGAAKLRRIQGLAR